MSWPQVAADGPDVLLASSVLIQPGVRYQHSEWPIDELMTMYLSDSAPDTFVLQRSPRCLELRGARGVLRIDRIDPASLAFRQALLDGHPLGDAAEKALECDRAFDAGRALAALVAANMVVGIIPSPEGTTE